MGLRKNQRSFWDLEKMKGLLGLRKNERSFWDLEKIRGHVQAFQAPISGSGKIRVPISGWIPKSGSGTRLPSPEIGAGSRNRGRVPKSGSGTRLPGPEIGSGNSRVPISGWVPKLGSGTGPSGTGPRISIWALLFVHGLQR